MQMNTFGESLALLRTRRFGTFWFASLLSNIGTWAQQVAQPWLLPSLGASSFLVGLDSFAMGAPVWFLTPAGGVLADRADRPPGGSAKRRWLLEHEHPSTAQCLGGKPRPESAFLPHIY